MALTAIPGGKVRVTVKKSITNDQAFKTIERLFMSDKVAAAPLVARSANFVSIPKRRGGRIWTKRPNKIHMLLNEGETATIKATPQHIRDLASVAKFVDVVTV